MKMKEYKIEPQNSFAYKEIFFDSWNEMKEYLFSFSTQNEKVKYVFRGHADSEWKLQPTIDRLKLEDPVSTESKAIVDFKKDITIFTQTNEISFLDYPKNNDEKDLNWLALMQHHGAATRLLDFSDSPFIATFFAMSNVYVKEKEKCIWAIPLNLIDKKNTTIITERGSSLDKIYENLKVDKSRKYDILGYSYLNKQFERLFRQQGCFIYSMSSNESFYDLLGVYFDNSSLENSSLLKITLKTNNNEEEILSAISDLKFMNITYSSLFPDLDGFSKDILLSEAYSR